MPRSNASSVNSDGRGGKPMRWTPEETKLLVETWNSVLVENKSNQSTEVFWDEIGAAMRLSAINIPFRSREELKAKWKDVKAGLRVRHEQFGSVNYGLQLGAATGSR